MLMKIDEVPLGIFHPQTINYKKPKAIISLLITSGTYKL